jgi:hypothetical protein
MHPEAKKLNEMNRLSDLGHFPALVNLGASVNIVFTLAVTWWIQPRYPQVFAPLLWVALVLFVNLLPVILLRLTLTADTVYRPLAEMDFIHDQHKFSDWVYLAASANMAFWILAGWSVFSISHTVTTLVAMLLVAFLATFLPVIARPFSLLATRG